MIKTKAISSRKAAERKALHRRARKMYDAFNRGLWEKCFSLIDPELRESSRVKLSVYADQMAAFQKVYRQIKPWHIRTSLHFEKGPRGDHSRPFAYVYVVWQDHANEYHMFRERWVKHADHWYTRVAGLVANRQNTSGK